MMGIATSTTVLIVAAFVDLSSGLSSGEGAGEASTSMDVLTCQAASLTPCETD